MGTAVAIATSTGRMDLVGSEGSIHLPASPELRQARRAALDGQIFLPGPCVLRSESLLAGVVMLAGFETREVHDHVARRCSLALQLHTRRGSLRRSCSVCWVCGMWSLCGGDNAQPSTVRFILNSKLILRGWLAKVGG